MYQKKVINTYNLETKNNAHVRRLTLLGNAPVLVVHLAHADFLDFRYTLRHSRTAKKERLSA